MIYLPNLPIYKSVHVHQHGSNQEKDNTENDMENVVMQSFR